MKIKLYVKVSEGTTAKQVRQHLIAGGYPETLCLINRESKTR
jgi:hypothetical protein